MHLGFRVPSYSWRGVIVGVFAGVVGLLNGWYFESDYFSALGGVHCSFCLERVFAVVTEGKSLSPCGLSAIICSIVILCNGNQVGIPRFKCWRYGAFGTNRV